MMEVKFYLPLFSWQVFNGASRRLKALLAGVPFSLCSPQRSNLFGTRAGVTFLFAWLNSALELHVQHTKDST